MTGNGPFILGRMGRGRNLDATRAPQVCYHVQRSQEIKSNGWKNTAAEGGRMGAQPAGHNRYPPIDKRGTATEREETVFTCVISRRRGAAGGGRMRILGPEGGEGARSHASGSGWRQSTGNCFPAGPKDFSVCGREIAFEGRKLCFWS